KQAALPLLRAQASTGEGWGEVCGRAVGKQITPRRAPASNPCGCELRSKQRSLSCEPKRASERSAERRQAGRSERRASSTAHPRPTHVVVSYEARSAPSPASLSEQGRGSGRGPWQGCRKAEQAAPRTRLQPMRL